MRITLTILLVFLLAVCRGQDLMPVRIKTIKNGVERNFNGYAVMTYDTARNGKYYHSLSDSLPHYIVPTVFLNAKKRVVKDTVIFFNYIFK